MLQKYELYENAVQTPVLHVKMFSDIYKEIIGKPALHLREDFCGTFLMSCHWAKQSEKHTATCLDIDPEPLNYGKKNHWAKLSTQEKKRVRPLRANVLIPTSKKDLIVACNFSFNVFKDRQVLLKYFRSCLKSLTSQGALALEMAGGPGMISASREQKTIYLNPTKKYVYIWEQKSFDPITHDARYAIHFKLPSGKVLQNAFLYDWRLWTIPEVRELMNEAGFKKTHVFWETSHRGEGTGEYARMENGDNAFAWIAYVVGVR